jgi:hypothetical protein
MARLAATDITVTLTPDDFDRSPDRVGFRTFPTVAWASAVKTYTTLGIPMPGINAFGFFKGIKRAYIEQPATGLIYHFDRTNMKLRIFIGAAVSVVVADHANIAGPATHANIAGPADHANIASIAHSHDLVLAGNGTYGGDGVTVQGSPGNNALVANQANAITVAGANAAKGGVANVTPGNVANLSHGNIANLAHGNIANLSHSVTGGAGGGALEEFTDNEAPGATTLYMEMVGQ